MYSSPYRRFDLITGSSIALADNVNAADGLKGNVLVVDELHRMKTKLYSVCYGMLADLPNSLEVIISTAGDGDTFHVSYQKYNYAKQVLSGEVIDTALLPVSRAPEDLPSKDIFSEEALVACNPVLQEVPEKLSEATQLAEMKQLNQVSWWQRSTASNQWIAQDGDEYI